MPGLPLTGTQRRWGRHRGGPGISEMDAGHRLTTPPGLLRGVPALQELGSARRTLARVNSKLGSS